MFKAIRSWWQKDVTGIPTPEIVRDLWLGPGTNFQGTLQCRGNVVLGGQVTSSRIETSGNILIATSGQVRADISACIVSVQGKFEGKLMADRAEILSGAHVSGQLRVNSIYRDDQAIVDAELFLLEAEGTERVQRPEEITSDVIKRTVHGAPNPPVEIGT